MMASNGAKPRSSRPDDLGLDLISIIKLSTFVRLKHLLQLLCFKHHTIVRFDNDAALKINLQCSNSAAILRSITNLYYSNTHTKISFVFRLEAQEQSQCQITMVKMAILRSCGPHGRHTQGKPNLTSQDPSMGLV